MFECAYADLATVSERGATFDMQLPSFVSHLSVLERSRLVRSKKRVVFRMTTGGSMGKLVFGMMQSLDGYVAGPDGALELPRPGDQLHRHFNDHVRGLAGIIYGRRIYEVMRYWDDDQPDWEAIEHDFAAAWRAKPKWVVSRTLDSVGPNATLVRDDVGAVVRAVKAKLDGEIDVAGPVLAGSLTALGLIDEYRLYFRPFVLGRGKPYFSGPRPPLRFVSADTVGEDAMRLTYVPSA